MSFYTALTGLNGSQADIAATSNNIANVGTTGFKRSRAEFGDIYATSPLQNASSAIGSGTILKGVKQQFTQGNIATSLNTLDLAITGQGFFAMKPSITSNQIVYTRNGSFGVDNQRNIVDSSGQLLLTYPVNGDGSVISKSIENATPLKLPMISGEPKVTRNVDLAVNLPADAPVILKNPKFSDGYRFDINDPDSYTASSSITIFDELGNPTIATVYFVKTQTASSSDPTSKFQTYLAVDGSIINPDLVEMVNDAKQPVYMDRFGRETTLDNIPDDTFFADGKGSALYKKDNLNQMVPSSPARLKGMQSAFDFGADGNKVIEITNDPIRFKATREGGNNDGSLFWGKDFLLVNVDDGDVPVSVDLRPGFYNATQLADEVERAINDAYGDDKKLQITANVDDKLSINFFNLNATDGALVGLDIPIEVDLLQATYVTEQQGIDTSGASPNFSRDVFIAHSQLRINETLNQYGISSPDRLGISENYFAQGQSREISAAPQVTEVFPVNYIHSREGAETYNFPAYDISNENFSDPQMKITVNVDGFKQHSLKIKKDAQPLIEDSEISIVGSEIYYGLGSQAVKIADLSGQGDTVPSPFHVTLTDQITNGDFELTLDDKNEIIGWDIFEERFRSGENTLDGIVINEDATYPIKNYDQDDADFEGTFEVFSEDGPYGKSLNLSISGKSNDFAVIKGPYIQSKNSVDLKAGDKISFKWSATSPNQNFDVMGILVNVETGEQHELLNETGQVSAWAQDSFTVPAAGKFKILFVSGSYSVNPTPELDDTNVTVSDPASEPLSLGSGEQASVGLYYGNCRGTNQLDFLNTFYTSQGDISAEQINNLDNFVPGSPELLVIFQPTSSFSADENTKFGAHLDAGGRIFFIGEHAGYSPNENANISQFIRSQGGDISVTSSNSNSNSFDRGVVGDKNLNNSPLMAGVESFQTALWAKLDLDESISKAILVGEGDGVALADQALSNGRVTLIADQNWLDNAYRLPGNETFLRNLAIDSYNNVRSVEGGTNPNSGFVSVNSTPTTKTTEFSIDDFSIERNVPADLNQLVVKKLMERLYVEGNSVDGAPEIGDLEIKTHPSDAVIFSKSFALSNTSEKYLLYSYQDAGPSVAVYENMHDIGATTQGLDNMVIDNAITTLKVRVPNVDQFALSQNVVLAGLQSENLKTSIEGKPLPISRIDRTDETGTDGFLIFDLSDIRANLSSISVREGGLKVLTNLSKEVEAYFHEQEAENGRYYNNKMILREVPDSVDNDYKNSEIFETHGKNILSVGTGIFAQENLQAANVNTLTALGLDNLAVDTLWVDEKNPPLKIGYDALTQTFQFGVNHRAIGPGTDSNFRAFKIYGAGDARGTNNLGIPAADGAETVPISSTGVFKAEPFVADGQEIQLDAKRYGVNVTYNRDLQSFTFSSGTTGEAVRAKGAIGVEVDQSASNIQVGRYSLDPETGAVLNGTFDTGTRSLGTGNNGLMGVGINKTEVSFTPGRGLKSEPAQVTSASAPSRLNEVFAISSVSGENLFNVSVNGINGIIEVPSGNYVGSTLAAALQTRINQISDGNTGAVVGGVTVQYQPESNNFVFTTATTGPQSTIKVKGAAKFGMDDIPLGVGSVPEIVNLIQATNPSGVPLYVNADGEIVETPPENLVEDYYPVYIDEGELTFDKTGQIISPINRVHYEHQGDGLAIDLNVDYSASTQLSQPFVVNGLYQDGFTSGRLTGLDIDSTGVLRANYTNGENKPLGKIVLANFNNQNGLKQIGNATFVATAVSGEPRFGEAGAEGFGSIRGGSLERSNVDITEELVNLITAQRNFQAASKAIETVNMTTQAILQMRSS